MSDKDIADKDINNMSINIIIPIGKFESTIQIYQFLDEFLNKFNDYLDAFHFFFENNEIGQVVEVRTRYKENCDGYVKSFIDNYFKNKETQKTSEIKYQDYNPEDGIYGMGDGWKIAEKLFEYCARVAIFIRTQKAGEGKAELFRESKFVHCFLNQLGYDSLGESSFHNYASQQMMIKHLREIEIPIYVQRIPIGIDNTADKSKKLGPEFG